MRFSVALAASSPRKTHPIGPGTSISVLRSFARLTCVRIAPVRTVERFSNAAVRSAPAQNVAPSPRRMATENC